ncbi:MAG: glycosyltransferase family 2 protein [Chloroflexi bacterium]|nr:glycosyltransferase family 2 protein [Chloroflexota bacterium]
MANRRPFVSIGMPVYNGERFVRLALESLLAQDYPNFELVVCDNASTDRTANICKAYTAGDRRVRYYRNETNLGAVRNFQRVLELSSGEFFMWAAHDDLWDPTYVSKCVSALERNPAAVLCATSACSIDEEGKIVGSHEENIETVGLDRLSRLGKVLTDMRLNTSFYGLLRREAVQRITWRNQFGFDHIFMAELSLLGEFVRLPEQYFYARVGGAHDRGVEGVMASQLIHSPIVRYLPNVSLFVYFLANAAGWRALSWIERLRAMGLVVRRFTSPPYSLYIKADIRRLVDSFVCSFGKRCRTGSSGAHCL